MKQRQIIPLLILISMLNMLLMAKGFALTVKKTSLKALTASSELIVLGKVTTVKYEWGDAAHRSIHTVITVAVTKYLKGEGGPSMSVRQLGGQIGDFGQVVPGSPEFAAGDEVVLFLQKHRGAYWIHSIALGSFAVAQDQSGERVVLNDLRGILVDEQLRPVDAEEAFIRMPLRQFIDAVQSFGE